MDARRRWRDAVKTAYRLPRSPVPPVPPVAVVNVRLPGMDGLQVLRRLREVSPATEVVVMTAHASGVSVVLAMRLGAFDYMTNPLDLDELRVMVQRAAAHQRIRLESSHLRQLCAGPPPPGDIVGGRSPPVH